MSRISLCETRIYCPPQNSLIVLQSRPYELRPGFCAERLGPLNRCTDRTVNDKLGKDPDGT